MHPLLKIFFLNGEPYTAAVRNFLNRYELSRHDCVPTRRSVMLWVNNFRPTESVLKRKLWKTFEIAHNNSWHPEQRMASQGRHIEDVIFKA